MKDTGSPSQVAGQTAQAEAAQEPVPAESAQTERDSEQMEDMHRRSQYRTTRNSQPVAGGPTEPVADGKELGTGAHAPGGPLRVPS